MLINREEEEISKLNARDILNALKERRKNVPLKKYFLEKDTYVYIENNSDADSKFQRFRKKLYASRKSNVTSSSLHKNLRGVID